MLMLFSDVEREIPRDLNELYKKCIEIKASDRPCLEQIKAILAKLKYRSTRLGGEPLVSSASTNVGDSSDEDELDGDYQPPEDGIPVPPWPSTPPASSSSKLSPTPVKATPKKSTSPVAAVRQTPEKSHGTAGATSPVPRKTTPERPGSRRESWCPINKECINCVDYKNENKRKQACKARPL